MESKKMVLALLLISSFVIAATYIPTSTQTNGSPSEETLVSGYHPSEPTELRGQEHDVVIWMAADSQPEPTERDRDYARLRNAADDLDSLPTSPSYILLPGDIANPYDAALNNRSGMKNLQKTRAAYDRISWFRTGAENGTLAVRGNHENRHVRNFSRVFGSACQSNNDKLIRVKTDTNLVVYGACGVRAGSKDKPISYVESFEALNRDLERLNRKGDNWNVIVTLHQPVPGTVADCHTAATGRDIEWMSTDSRKMYKNISKRWGDKYLIATITGHTHGTFGSTNQSVVEKWDVAFIDLPVFGNGAISNNRVGNCGGFGDVGNSMFMTLNESSSEAQLHIRHSCDDPDRDGGCNQSGYWTTVQKPVELDHPLQNRTRKELN